jgi:Uma2 family endonuclease
MESMPNASSKRIRFDPTIYPVTEKMGEDLLQCWIAELLRPLLEHWLLGRGVRALVGADQFIYYQRFNSAARVAPDVYVLPGVAPDTRVGSWKIWETGIVPSFALEIVSRDWAKDYFESPERYAQIGVPEVVVYDPDPVGRDRVRWQVYRPVRGKLRLAEATQADRVRSRALGCYLRSVGAQQAQRIRVATGGRGEVLFPTEAEALHSERAAKEAERAAKEVALARVTELEAELARRGRRRR